MDWLSGVLTYIAVDFDLILHKTAFIFDWFANIYSREKKKQKRKLKEENRAPDYVIIKEGSKAGMDLLKDKFGYTYTMRKVKFALFKF